MKKVITLFTKVRGMLIQKHVLFTCKSRFPMLHYSKVLLCSYAAIRVVYYVLNPTLLREYSKSCTLQHYVVISHTAAAETF